MFIFFDAIELGVEALGFDDLDEYLNDLGILL